MAIIISDIHGDIAKAKAFLSYKPDVEHVFLGDLVDSRDPKATFEDELACLEFVLASDATLVWGNHDLAYTLLRSWKVFTHFSILPQALTDQYKDGSDYLKSCYHEFGEDLYAVHLFIDRIQPHFSRFKAAHAVDGWLCTHAGLSSAVTKALPDCPMNSGNPADVAAYLNEEFRREIKKHKTPRDNRPLEYGVGPLFAAASARGGDNAYGGIFWYDHQRELAKPDPRIKQIFGHTPVPGPLRRDLWNNINIESGCWVFDTAKNDFVMLDEKR
jgi:hypothetical protein